MKKTFLILLAFLCSSSLYLQAQTTEVVYLSGKGSDDAVLWDFYCTDGRKSGQWDKIPVPSCWEMEGFGVFNYGQDRNKGTEEGLYKTTFEAPTDWRGKRVFIVFEGSMTDTEVKINGQIAGPIHQGAFYRFKYDITRLVRLGRENTLEVKVSKMSSNESVTLAERRADYWIFGGIFRPVYLEVAPEHPIEYTAIDAKADGSINADIFMYDALSNLSAETIITDMNSREIGRVSSGVNSATGNKISVSGKITGVDPWSSEHPNLYYATTTVSRNGTILHTVKERIGFRTIEVRERDGIYINGERIRFQGVNRHSHWPTTGRTTNRRISVEQAKLMKEMNMNAVRMSHYPPDSHLLEICDSLGLYVIDELCSWQRPPYDTEVGSKLVREMLVRDINHASVVIWANGNEGGFNHDLDPLFDLYDIQKRAVIHPWANHGGFNTVHYINYNVGVKDMFNGRDIFMPTEHIHGLYDGGHGAGLDDFWNLMVANPRSAGMFLWDFADQAVVRNDRNNELDTDKDHGADGILGPYGEKEGSFYTVKQIWSPIQLENILITPKWNGKIKVENRYSFTNADQCKFSYRLAKYNGLSKSSLQTTSGSITAPDIAPGRSGEITLNLPSSWQDYDFLYITVDGHDGEELFTWTYEISGPDKVALRLLPEVQGSVTAGETAGGYTLAAGNVKVEIGKNDGLLSSVMSGGQSVPLTNGPLLITDRNLKCENTGLVKNSDGSAEVNVEYRYEDNSQFAYRFTWRMLPSGILELDYNYPQPDQVAMWGLTFDFPEDGVKGATLLANGPYRVYKNRMKGGSVSLWDKTYNDTRTGETWEYPEFKGYYSLFYAVKLDCPTPFEVYSGTDDMFLHLFTPTPQQSYDVNRNHTLAPYPKGNISFLDAIPAVGTKFGAAELYGPQSQLNISSFGREASLSGKLYFKFF